MRLKINVLSTEKKENKEIRSTKYIIFETLFSMDMLKKSMFKCLYLSKPISTKNASKNIKYPVHLSLTHQYREHED